MLNLPRNDLKKQEILSKIAEKFQKGKNYSEQEIDEIIKNFKVNDYILFRRELVNFNYFGKDSYKGVYWLKTKKLSEEELNKISKNSKAIEKL
jgi:hypothetical protein